MDLLVSKILALFLLSGIILFFILLPIKVATFVERKGSKGKLFLSCCNCFGGGVFLGMYMLHMSPEVRAMLEESLLIPKGITYPVPEIIAGAGFFGILLFENFIHYMQRRPVEKKSQELTQTYTDLAEGEITDGVYVRKPSSSGNLQALENGSAKTAEVYVTVADDKVSESDEKTGEVVAAQVRSIVMMIALALDCIFEGMALGLMYTNVAVWNLFIAIIGHEFIVSFCLGLELVRTQKRTRGVVLSGVFYALTPAIGVAIGIAIFEGPGESDISVAIGILQAIATGIFLYCTFIGILAEELADRSRLIQVVMVLLGYLLLAGLALIPDGEDEVPGADPTGMVSAVVSTMAM